jgi:hypothetical protein
MASKQKPRFKLDDFKDGAVCGVLCFDAFKDDSLLDPVRQWVAEGKLFFAPGQSDVLQDVLYLKESMPSPAIADTSAVQKVPVPMLATKPDRSVIDPKSWPYQCGVMARKSGRANTVEVHGLVIDSGSHKQWTAGWEAEGKRTRA